MSQALRDAFVAGAKWGWDNRQRPTRETWAMVEALRRYSDEAPVQEPRGDGLMPPFATFCPECGPNVQIDEDGTCSSCGATAIGSGLTKLNERIAALATPAEEPRGDGLATRWSLQNVLTFMAKWGNELSQEIVEHIFGPSEPEDIDTFVK